MAYQMGPKSNQAIVIQHSSLYRPHIGQKRFYYVMLQQIFRQILNFTLIPACWFVCLYTPMWGKLFVCLLFTVALEVESFHCKPSVESHLKLGEAPSSFYTMYTGYGPQLAYTHCTG